MRDSVHRATSHSLSQKLGLHQSDSGADLSEYHDQHEAKSIHNLVATYGKSFTALESKTGIKEKDEKCNDALLRPLIESGTLIEENIEDEAKEKVLESRSQFFRSKLSVRHFVVLCSSLFSFSSLKFVSIVLRGLIIANVFSLELNRRKKRQHQNQH